MTSYPIPSYAAHIWLTGDEINIAFPSPLDAPSHVVHFPANARGFALALRIMQEREHAETDNALRLLATRAAPTQYQIEAMYRAITKSDKLAELKEKVAVSAKEKAEAEEFLKEFGL